MIRQIVGLSVLLLVVGMAAAQDAKKDAPKANYVIGIFESYKNEILTLKVENKDKEFKVPKDFKVPEDTLVGYASGKEEPKIEKAKEHLKDVKKGSLVSVTLDRDNKKVQAVGVFLPKESKDAAKAKDEEKNEK